MVQSVFGCVFADVDNDCEIFTKLTLTHTKDKSEKKTEQKITDYITIRFLNWKDLLPTICILYVIDRE